MEKVTILSISNTGFHEAHISWSHIFSVGFQKTSLRIISGKKLFSYNANIGGPVFKATRPSCRCM